jgi:ABC-type branched-subunit amino acid transport system substrate-binding protein
MGERMTWKAGLYCLLIGLGASVAAGCKSDGAADVLDPATVATDPQAAESAIPAVGKIGTGPVHIAVLLPSNGSTAVADGSRDVRDGVTMAVEDLGSDVLTVTFEDQSATGKPREAVLKAMASGAAAVVGPFELGPAAEVATVKGTTLKPIFLLADGVPGSASVYSVPLQSGTSAAAGTRAVAKEGGRKFVLIARDGNSAATMEKAVDFAAADFGGRIAAQARFGPDQASVTKAIDTVLEVVQAPDAIVIAGPVADPVALVKAVRVRSPKAKIIGNSSWISSMPIDPGLDGILIADIDRSEIEPVASRFRARFGHEFEPLAAYAYDVIALSSGIAKAIGKEGFVRQIVEDKKGFRGATGIFRFRSDGNSERLLALYRVERGKLKRLEAPPKLF